MLYAAFAVIVFVLLPAGAIVFGADAPDREAGSLQW
jgi:hypothetical protein